MLCGAALSPCKKTRNRPARSTTATDTLLPFFAHSATAPCATWPSGTGAAWKPHRSGIGQPDCTPFPVSATAAPGLCHPAPPLITHRAPGVVRCRMITVASLADTAIELPHPLRYDGHSTSAADGRAGAIHPGHHLSFADNRLAETRC